MRLALTLALLAVLASCTGEPFGSQPGGEGEAVPHLALYPAGPTHDALINGRLMTTGRCLLLVTPDETTWGLAWPADRTRWDAEASEIVVNDSGAAVGDDVWIGGGPATVTAETLSDPRWEWVEPPRVECLGQEFWVADSVSTDEP